MKTPRRPAPAPAPAPAAASRARPKAAAYLVPQIADDEVTIQPMKTEFFRSLQSLKAEAVTDLPVRSAHSLDELYAIAEVGYHYLFAGGTRLAFVIFDALAVLAPGEAYFSLALGLAADRMGDKRGARAAYARAAELDPRDGRPLVNLAELCLEAGDVNGAKNYLARALPKTRAKGDLALEKKASAILDHLRSQS